MVNFEQDSNISWMMIYSKFWGVGEGGTMGNLSFLWEFGELEGKFGFRGGGYVMMGFLEMCIWVNRNLIGVI